MKTSTVNIQGLDEPQPEAFLGQAPNPRPPRGTLVLQTLPDGLIVSIGFNPLTHSPSHMLATFRWN